MGRHGVRLGAKFPNDDYDRLVGVVESPDFVALVHDAACDGARGERERDRHRNDSPGSSSSEVFHRLTEPRGRPTGNGSKGQIAFSYSEGSLEAERSVVERSPDDRPGAAQFAHGGQVRGRLRIPPEAMIEPRPMPTSRSSRRRSGPPRRPSRSMAVTSNVVTPASARRSISSSGGQAGRRPSASHRRAPGRHERRPRRRPGPRRGSATIEARNARVADRGSAEGDPCRRLERRHSRHAPPSVVRRSSRPAPGRRRPRRRRS